MCDLPVISAILVGSIFLDQIFFMMSTVLTQRNGFFSASGINHLCGFLVACFTVFKLLALSVLRTWWLGTWHLRA
jgi:hypothetical protein